MSAGNSNIAKSVHQRLLNIAKEIFISPVLRSIHQGAAFEYTWLPGGPWEYVRSILNKK